MTPKSNHENRHLTTRTKPTLKMHTSATNLLTSFRYKIVTIIELYQRRTLKGSSPAAFHKYRSNPSPRQSSYRCDWDGSWGVLKIVSRSLLNIALRLNFKDVWHAVKLVDDWALLWSLSIILSVIDEHESAVITENHLGIKGWIEEVKLIGKVPNLYLKEAKMRVMRRSRRSDEDFLLTLNCWCLLWRLCWCFWGKVSRWDSSKF